MLRDFPLDDTLADGTYRVTDCLLGEGSQRLCLGTRQAGPGEQYFISIMFARKAPVEELRKQLDYAIPGIHEFAHIGFFDPQGDDYVRNSDQTHYCALVEKVPEGEWLPRFVNRPLGALTAAELGLSVGRILERALKAGYLLAGIRPEYIWVRREPATQRLRVASLSGRTRDFFAHTKRGSTLFSFLFRRHYLAPEVYAERGELEESLVFTLAVMIAEWASGQFPFPDSWASGSMLSQCEGRHAPLEMPEPLAALLALCLRREPTERPTLSLFLKRLRKLTADELAL